MKPDFRCDVCDKEVAHPLTLIGEIYVFNIGSEDFSFADGFFRFCSKKCFNELVFSSLTSEEVGVDLSGA